MIEQIIDLVFSVNVTIENHLDSIASIISSTKYTFIANQLSQSNKFIKPFSSIGGHSVVHLTRLLGHLSLIIETYTA